MVDAAQPSEAAPDAVVRPLSRVAERPCARPGCPAPARATLTFRYASREVSLVRLADEPTPQAYDLCAAHASRTRPPHGWELRDRRPEEERRAPDVPPATPADLGGERTVAVLAAALREAPDSSSAPGDRARAAEVAPGDDRVVPAETSEDHSSPVLGRQVGVEPARPRPVLAEREDPPRAGSPSAPVGGSGPARPRGRPTDGTPTSRAADW